MEHSLPQSSSFPDERSHFFFTNPHRLLVEQSCEFALFAVDVNGRIVTWNEGARRLFGHEEAEVTNSSFSLLFTAEDRNTQVPEEELHRARCQGRAEETHCYLRKDGTHFLGNSVTTPLRDEEGTTVGYAKIVRDQAPREQVEHELTLSQGRFDLLARATNDTVRDWNLETNEVWWNDAAIALYGLKRTPNPSTANWWYEHIHPDDRERVAASIKAVTQNGLQSWSQEYRCLRKDGSIAHVLDQGYALLNEDGRPTRMMGAMTDITHHKESEQEREQLIEQAETASRLKDEFLATLSHELRTPLQSILGYTNLLQSGRLGLEDSEKALEAIERSAVAQSALIEDVLDVSRILTGKLRLEVGPVDMAKCIGGALEAVGPAAIAKDIRLILDLAPDVPLVTGDAARLQQVMWNLLSNAIKFTPCCGNVTISLQNGDGHAWIAVIDSGQGIAPQFLPYVFDRFRQADSSSTRAHSGLGIGLSIVRQMVELHGGTIEAHSEGEGRGSTFIVQLPQLDATLHEEASVTASSVATARRAVPSHRELDGVYALVVEDQQEARELVRIVLEGHGAQVTAVGSVSAAIQFLRQSRTRPHIILSDIGMSDQSGYALAEQLRALEVAAGLPPIPAIAVTAFASGEDKAKALDAGFDQHVAKPIQGSELVAIVHHYTIGRAH